MSYRKYSYPEPQLTDLNPRTKVVDTQISGTLQDS